ncbi:MAG: 50S ribosomal protein L21 [Nitrospinota bacterium]
MYAIIQSGGKQHRVKAGDIVRVERLAGEVGQEVELGPVLLLGQGEGVELSPEVLGGARVRALIRAQDRARKVRVFKKKRRKGYTRRRGHRQAYTELQVTAIEGPPGDEAALPAGEERVAEAPGR